MKNVFLKFRKIHRKTPVESQACNCIKKRDCNTVVFCVNFVKFLRANFQ